jgi:predicted nucleic acid-binding protein
VIFLDLNVLLDVLQRREPHVRASAAVVERVVKERDVGVVSAHVVTTLHSLVARYANVSLAETTVDWLLAHFVVASIGREELIRARGLPMRDFEDAVVSAAAEAAGCHSVVSRNVRDFRGSPVPAVTPNEYLAASALD